nr:hypothetical protein Ahy_A05g021717 isoform D [Ipomoea batatas]
MFVHTLRSSKAELHLEKVVKALMAKGSAVFRMKRSISVAFSWTFGGSDLNPNTRKAVAQKCLFPESGILFAAAASILTEMGVGASHAPTWSILEAKRFLLCCKTADENASVFIRKGLLLQNCSSAMPETRAPKPLVEFVNEFFLSNRILPFVSPVDQSRCIRYRQRMKLQWIDVHHPRNPRCDDHMSATCVAWD